MSSSPIEIPSGRRLELLAAAPSFEWLPAKVLSEISSKLLVEAFSAGEVIVKEREEGDRMYFIESGEVSVSVQGAAGSVLLGSMRAGEIFGEIALVSDAGKRRATVVADSPVVLLTLTSADFEQICQAFPELRMDLSNSADSLMMSRLEALMSAKARAEGA